MRRSGKGDHSLSSGDDRRHTIARLAYETTRSTIASQDSQAAQFITAAAFFLAGVAALLSIDKVRNARFIFDNGATANLPTISLVFSLLLVSGAVIHAIMSLGPQIRHFQHVALTRPSFLSFLSVSERPRSQWQELFDEGVTNSQLDDYELEMYIFQSRELAMEAQYKYGRLGEARALLFLAVALLAPGLIFVLDALSQQSSILIWNYKVSLATGAIIGMLTYFAARDRYRIEFDIDSPAEKGATVWVLRRFSIWLPISAALTVQAISGNPLWLLASLFALLPIILAVRNRAKIQGKEKWRELDTVSSALLIVVSIPQVVFYVITNMRVFLILAALFPLIFLEGIRIVDLQELLTGRRPT